MAGPAWGNWVSHSYEPQPPAAKSLTTLPVQKVTVPSGDMAVLQSKATAEVSFDWDERIVAQGRVYEDTAKKTLVLTSPLAATYRVTATWFEPAKGKFKEIWYVEFVGGPKPPPGPDPPPPDSLESRMKKAYEADKTAGKVTESELRLVGEICKAADQFFGVVPTTGTLHQVLDLGLGTAAPKGMPEVRRVIDARLAQVAPRVPDVPLTDALKAALKVAFSELAKAIDACLSPQPPPGPTPVPGARQVLLVRETANSTFQLTQTIIALRAGLHAKALKDKGHSLTILDDDAVGPDGKPAPILERWRPHYQNLKLPALVVADSTGNVVHKEVIPDNATAEQIMEIIRKAGG